MPIYSRVIRKDRVYLLPDLSAVQLEQNPNLQMLQHYINSPNLMDILRYFKKNRTTLERYIKGYLPKTESENLINYILEIKQPTPDLSPEQEKKSLDLAIKTYLKSDQYDTRINNIKKKPLDHYDSARRNSCLVGQLILSAERELNDFDRYLTLDEDQVIGWSISRHMYDRLLEPNLYKLSRIRFFTNAYSRGNRHQCVSGATVGPLCTGLLAALVVATFSGVAAAPFILIGVCCLPSLVYLEKGLLELTEVVKLFCFEEAYPDRLLDIKTHLQHALSCFFIALLLPMVWASSFPLELVRFITRSVSTAVVEIRDCIESFCHDLDDIYSDDFNFGIP